MVGILRGVRGTAAGVVAVVACAAITAAAPAGRNAAAARLHIHLLKSEPAVNDTVASPNAIRFWFSEKVELKVSTVKLTNAARTSVALGVLTRSGEDEKGPLVATVSAPLAPGGYTVSWRSASADGHAMSGTIEFVVKER